MLNMGGRGEMKTLKPNKDVRDDKVVKTATMKFEFKGVPVEVALGFIGQLDLFYSKDGDFRIGGDVEWLPVGRHISNVLANIGGVVIEHCVIKGARIYGRDKRLTDITFTLVGDILSGMDELHSMLKDMIEVNLVEQEYTVEESSEEEDDDEHKEAA